MSSSIRINNSEFYYKTGIVADATSNAQEVAGARGVAIVVTITDSGSAAGSIALECSLDGTNFVGIADTPTTLSFTGSSMKILYNVVDPMYNYVRIAVTRSAGTMVVKGEITVVEGGY